VAVPRSTAPTGGGRCFPSYERIARVAKCCRDSVCVAIAALEEAGLLTWVHRITRIRRREQDLFGQWGSVCRSSALRTRTSFSIRWSASRGGAAMWHVKRKIRLDPRTEVALLSTTERAALVTRLDSKPTKADWGAWERDLEARLG